MESTGPSHHSAADSGSVQLYMLSPLLCGVSLGFPSPVVTPIQLFGELKQ